MVRKIALLIMIAITLGCQQTPEKKSKGTDTSNAPIAKIARPEEQLDTLKKFKLEPGEELLYQDDWIASIIDAKRRGAGVISFQLDINDRLDILNDDGTPFGNIVMNEDMTFYTLDMPQKVVARKVVPNADFAAFDFDAEPVQSNDEYLRIYVNKKLRKIKKAGTKYRFMDWKQYLIDEKDSTDVAED